MSQTINCKHIIALETLVIIHTYDVHLIVSFKSDTNNFSQQDVVYLMQRKCMMLHIITLDPCREGGNKRCFCTSVRLSVRHVVNN